MLDASTLGALQQHAAMDPWRVTSFGQVHFTELLKEVRVPATGLGVLDGVPLMLLSRDLQHNNFRCPDNT